MRKTRYIGWALWTAVGLLGGGTAVAQSTRYNCENEHELLPFFPSAHMHDMRGYQGFVRLVNHGPSGWIKVFARADDDDETTYDIDVEVPGHSSVHFNSEDLEEGNPSKGIYYGGIYQGGPGAKNTGLWSLCIDRQDNDVEATSYVRSDDGFLTETTLPVQGHDLHDVCVDRRASLNGELCAKWAIPIFNPGYNTNQVSMLRILNNTAVAKTVEIRGTRGDGTNTYCEDIEGKHSVLFSLGPSEGVTLESRELETGSGLPDKLTEVEDRGVSHGIGMIGTARGKWVIDVFADAESPEDLVVMNLLYAPRDGGKAGGSIVNLSANADDAVTRRKDYEEQRTLRPIGGGETADDGYCPLMP